MSPVELIIFIFILLPLGLIGSFYLVKHWRKTLLFIPIWLLLVGIFRKWVFTGISDILFFTPHFLVGLVYLGYLKEYGFKFENNKLILMILISMLWGIFSLLNPRLPSLLVGLLGLIIYFWFFPLIFVVPKVIKDKDHLIKLFKIYLLISIPFLIFGIIQYGFPIDSPINKFVSGDSNAGFYGGAPRITSTFPHGGMYTPYLAILSLLLIFLINRNKTKNENLIYLGISILFIINMLMTGARGLVLSFLLILMAFYTLALYRKLIKLNKMVFLPVVVILFLFLIISFVPLANVSYGNFMDRFKSNHDLGTRITDALVPVSAFSDSGIFGYGIGTTYTPAKKLTSNSFEHIPDVEIEQYRIMVELGLIGFILIYSIRLYVIYLFYSISKKIKDIDLKKLAILIFAWHLVNLVSLHIVFNWVNNFFYWFSVGILFLLYHFDKK